MAASQDEDAVGRADNSFICATEYATLALSENSPLVWELAMRTASEGCQYNRMVRDGVRNFLNGNSDTAKANRGRLEELLQKASLRVPVCLKISADANYELALAGYTKNDGTSRGAKSHMMAAAINCKLAHGEYAALEDWLKKSLPSDFRKQVLTVWLSAHHLLASSAYCSAERMQKSIGSKAHKESRADYHTLLDDAAQNFRASLGVIDIAKHSGVAMPPLTAQMATGMENDLRRISEICPETAEPLHITLRQAPRQSGFYIITMGK